LEHPVSSSAVPSLDTLLATLRLNPLKEVCLCLGLAAAADTKQIR
jgi:hypothetical protein